MCAGNNYSEDGVNMIAHALKENKSLRFLSLAGNPLTDQSVAHLAQVVHLEASRTCVCIGFQWLSIG